MRGAAVIVTFQTRVQVVRSPAATHGQVQRVKPASRRHLLSLSNYKLLATFVIRQLFQAVPRVINFHQRLKLVLAIELRVPRRWFILSHFFYY